MADFLKVKMSINGPGSKLLVLGMVIQPLIGNPYNGYINPYYWVDDHPLLYGNIGSLDPSTNDKYANPMDPSWVRKSPGASHSPVRLGLPGHCSNHSHSLG